MPHRSHSAAPTCESPVGRPSRSRSKSPRRSNDHHHQHHRSLSPPEARPPSADYTMGVHGGGNRHNRFQSRSATATPTGSPKKRQLPQVPNVLARALQERVAQDLDDRAGRNRGRWVYPSLIVVSIVWIPSTVPPLNLQNDYRLRDPFSK